MVFLLLLLILRVLQMILSMSATQEQLTDERMFLSMSTSQDLTQTTQVSSGSNQMSQIHLMMSSLNPYLTTDRLVIFLLATYRLLTANRPILTYKLLMTIRPVLMYRPVMSYLIAIHLAWVYSSNKMTVCILNGTTMTDYFMMKYPSTQILQGH